MRRRVAAAVGVLTFGAALAGFLWVGSLAQSGEIRVLVASRTITAGQVVQASTEDLSPGGELVHLSGAANRDVIPEANYRQVQGAVALVTIPQGALILRHDLALGGSASLREVSLSLAFMPTGLEAGDRVDLFAVSGSQVGEVSPAANLCSGGGEEAGCVVPLAQSVTVQAVNSSAHSLSIEVAPDKVAPWLLLDATQSIWAVPSGVASCEGAEQSTSNPSQALEAIRARGAHPDCRAGVTDGTRG
ncbi:MAG: SAF domain-containing protein [Candidatus Dormibacteria bacterium]